MLPHLDHQVDQRFGTGGADLSSTQHAESPFDPMSIRDRLLFDHRRLEGILDRLSIVVAAADPTPIQRVFSVLASALLTHIEAEEAFLVPPLLRAREREGRSILAEHQHIRARLLELQAGIDECLLRIEATRDSNQRIETKPPDLTAKSEHSEEVSIVALMTGGTRAFVEELKAHARHEDGLYQWADLHLDESDRASLLHLIEKAPSAQTESTPNQQ
ncbi:MAG: hypothetical protein NVS3B20_05150 [Polyangiales bacterium]